MSETITFIPYPSFAGGYTWQVRDLTNSAVLATDSTPNGYSVSNVTVGSTFIWSVTVPAIIDNHPIVLFILRPGNNRSIGTRYDIPLFTYTAAGNVLTFNWDNTPFTYNLVPAREIVSWVWDFGDGIIESYGAIETVTHEYAEEFWNSNVTARCKAYDQYGILMDGYLSDFATGWHRREVTVGEGVSPRFGSFMDRFGTLYTAVNESAAVRVSRFKTDAPSSRELLATIPNAKNPSLFQKKNGDIICGATDRSSGDLVRRVSTNFGKEFS